ncbi:hypothetical protein D3C72_2242480 [compost metagenome]
MVDICGFFPLEEMPAAGYDFILRGAERWLYRQNQLSYRDRVYESIGNEPVFLSE